MSRNSRQAARRDEESSSNLEVERINDSVIATEYKPGDDDSEIENIVEENFREAEECDNDSDTSVML